MRHSIITAQIDIHIFFDKSIYACFISSCGFIVSVFAFCVIYSSNNLLYLDFEYNKPNNFPFWASYFFTYKNRVLKYNELCNI